MYRAQVPMKYFSNSLQIILIKLKAQIVPNSQALICLAYLGAIQIIRDTFLVYFRPLPPPRVIWLHWLAPPPRVT